MSLPETTHVEVEDGDNVVVRLNRPEQKNALHFDLVNELRDLWTELNKSPREGVLLTGAGNVTCAGMDTSVPENNSTEYLNSYIETSRELFDIIGLHPAPIVMAAKGAAIGAGFVLSMACDFVVLGEETTYSLPEVKYDIKPLESGELLTEIAGLRIAKELAATGEPISPKRAYEVGLVNEVVSEDKVEERAMQMLNSITDHDPDVVRNTLDAFK